MTLGESLLSAWRFAAKAAKGALDSKKEERIKETKESPEQLATKKFNEIFKGIFGNNNISSPETHKMEIQKEGWISWILEASYNPKNGYKSMAIRWGKWEEASRYHLSYDSWKFTLSSGGDINNFNETVKNLTGKEVLDNILPKFEKRLNEAKALESTRRKKAIGDAGKLAYQEDQNDANKLLDDWDQA